MKCKKVISCLMVFFLLVGVFTPLNGIFNKDEVPIEVEAASYDGWGDTTNGASKNKKCPYTGTRQYELIGGAVCFGCTTSDHPNYQYRGELLLDEETPSGQKAIELYDPLLNKIHRYVTGPGVNFKIVTDKSVWSDYGEFLEDYLGKYFEDDDGHRHYNVRVVELYDCYNCTVTGEAEIELTQTY